MPVYGIRINGLKADNDELLVRADSAAQAKDQVLELRTLTAEQMADALENGRKIYKTGDPVIDPERLVVTDGAGDMAGGETPGDSAEAE
jgi:hypothetical protein